MIFPDGVVSQVCRISAKWPENLTLETCDQRLHRPVLKKSPDSIRIKARISVEFSVYTGCSEPSLGAFGKDGLCCGVADFDFRLRFCVI